MEDFFVTVEFDEKDYIQVVEVFTYDADGEPVPHPQATAATEALTTCSDGPWESILTQQIESNLSSAGIAFSSVTIEYG